MDVTFAQAIRGAWLLLALTIIAIVSQGVHDIAIEHLGVPYPKLIDPPAWVGLAGDVGRILSLMIFAHLARRFLDARNVLAACILVGAFEIFLTARLRHAVIIVFACEAWRDGSWRFILLDLLSPLLTSVAQGAAALLIMRRLAAKNALMAIAAAVLAGAAIRFGLTPGTAEVATWLQATSRVVEPKQVHSPPYGGIMLVVIYLTFLEPTVAAFVMAKLAWPGLPSGRAERIAFFTLLILGCAGQLTSLLLNTWWVRQPPLLALASEVQFAAETAVMAAAAAWLATLRLVEPDADQVTAKT